MISLAPHPDAQPATASIVVEAHAERRSDGRLVLAYNLEGELSRLRLPDTTDHGPTDDELWRHTCFEAFVMAGEGPGYREFNFSPSGEWAVYDFRGYRDGGELESELAPNIVVRRTLNRLELDAQIDRDFLPQGRPLRLGLSAVVEDADGVLSYWALRHPPGKHDFHRADSFAMQLALP